MDTKPLYTIDCGIGVINYTTDNLQLQQLMEALEAAIKAHGAKRILTTLQNIT